MDSLRVSFYFTNRICYYFSNLSSLASHTKHTFLLFPNVSHVWWSNRIICFSRHFAFLSHVGVGTDSNLHTFMYMYVGWEETPILGYEVSFIHSWWFHIPFSRGLNYEFLRDRGFEENFDIQDLTNRSYPMALEVVFYWRVSNSLCREIPNLSLPYLVAGHSWRSTL